MQSVLYPEFFEHTSIYITRPIQQYRNTSGYNTESKNAAFNQLRMLQYFITKQIFLNIFHQPLHILTDSINNNTKLGMPKGRSIQVVANKVSLMLKNSNS